MDERLRSAAEAMETPLNAFRHALKVHMAGLELFTAATDLVTAAMATGDLDKMHSALTEFSETASKVGRSNAAFEVVLDSLQVAIVELVAALHEAAR